MNVIVLVKGAANLFIKRFAGPFWIRRRWLNKTQWLDKEQLEEIQLKLLQRLVKHCYQYVPYYRKLMDERGVNAENLKTQEDIKQFPILTKNNVLLAGDSIVSTKYPRWLLTKAFTGGTTGTPLTLRRDIFSIGNEQAFVRRQFDWAGVKIGDKCAFLTGRIIVRPDQVTGRLYAYDFFMKELILSTYHLSPDTAKQYAAVMKKYGVVALAGYPSAVYLLAKVCLDSGIKLKLQAALTSSETLTDSMRSMIARAFQCQVFDFYGSAERVCYIFTCEKGRYHLIPEYGLTELISVDGSSNEFRIVSTGFWNMAMPLIRYDTGDVVIISDKSCSCGRFFPMIESIKGRKGDLIKTVSGREFGAAILTHLLYGTNHILESQIIQDSLDHIIIHYVPGILFSKSDFDSFRRLLQKHLPSELKFEFKQVPSVQKTTGGKIKPVVSLIGKKDCI
jgi:phenylacetate-CoA ligase